LPDRCHAIRDLAGRLTDRVQLSSDGHRSYLKAISEAFEGEVDWGVVKKIYQAEGGSGPERRYSPAVCVAAERKTVLGEPDEK
jgi:hypothetical protein